MPVLPALPYKLIGIGLGALAALAFVLMAFHWKAQASDRKDQLAAICTATRAASGQPKLDCKQVPQQIVFMGQAIGTLTTAVHKQNEAVAAMGAETSRQQGEADRASKAAQERARAPEAASTRLTASSRAGERLAKPCEPSRALQESWR
jgi:hypothetical protein